LALAGEWDRTAPNFLASADDAHGLSPDQLDRDVERREYPCGETRFFAQQAKQDVLGTDVVVSESPPLRETASRLGGPLL
jgi:hypothetical protein